MDGNPKQIRQRLRSGAAENRTADSDNAYAADGGSSLAQSHAKRLKVAKSSRVTIGANDAMKPPRFAKRTPGQNNPMGDIDLTLSAKAKDLHGGVGKALLPQSLHG